MKSLRKSIAKIREATHAVKATLIDYSERSTIHGINYIGERGRSWFERLVWFCICVLSVFCCASLISDAWNINPIIISFEENPTSVWQIPFPAIVLCPSTMTQKSIFDLVEVDRRVKKLKNSISLKQFTADELEKWGVLSSLCRVLSQTRFESTMNCSRCLEIIRRIRIRPEDIFAQCKFRNTEIGCIDSFRELLFPERMCYSFNGLEPYRHHDADGQSRQWQVDVGFNADARMDTYPRRTVAAGIKSGFSVLLRLNSNDYEYICGKEQGFEIAFFMPNEIPQVYPNGNLQIQMLQSTSVVVTPKIMTTSDELRNYPVATRNCYFSDERYLRFFKEYTQNNCDVECQANLSLARVGCVLPYIPADSGAEICGPNMFGSYFFLIDQYDTNEAEGCDCLPSCNTISYEVEMSTIKLNTSKLPDSQDGYEYTEIIVYFKESQFISSKRMKRYGSTEFFANCGGLLGLCLGISLISIIEIVYFSTVRLFFKLQGDVLQQVQSKLIESTNWLKHLRRLALDYSKRTSIQGLGYIADNDRPIIERLLWLSVFLLSVLSCGLLIKNVFQRYEESPIIITYAESETLITDIPFPSVTICPQAITKKRVLDITEMHSRFKYQNLSLYQLRQKDMNRLTAAAQVCDPELSKDIDPENRTNCRRCVSTLFKLTEDIKDFLEFCVDIMVSGCEYLFDDIITEEGVCYTYNQREYFRGYNDSYLDEPQLWSNLEEGYSAKNYSFLDYFPMRGSKYSLIVYLRQKLENMQSICKGPIQGFKVFLHLPNEAPQTSKHYYMVPMYRAVNLILIPKMVVTRPELRGYPPQVRQCYFNKERYLRFFQYYTQNNCETECVANLTLKTCGCHRFSVPAYEGIKYCGIGEINCQQQMMRQANYDELMTACDCLPACMSLTFDAQIYQSERLEFFKNGSIYASAKLKVFFASSQFVALQRSLLFSPIEMIAYCGSLLGLFLGFSFISLLEIVYFLTIRLCCNLRLE